MASPEKNSSDLALIERTLAASEWFSSWPVDPMRRLMASAFLRRHKRGSLVLGADVETPEILVLLLGHLIVSLPDVEGLGVGSVILGPGMLAGLPQALEHASYDYYAHDSVVAVHVGAHVVLNILDSDPRLWRGMARSLLEQQGKMLQMSIHQRYGPLRRRLAATLEQLASLHGLEDHAQGQRIRLRLSQADLARMLQVARQSINREMGSLEALGILTAAYSAVIVHDFPALQALARDLSIKLTDGSSEH